MLAAPPNGAVVSKLLTMNDDQTKKDLEGKQESKLQAFVIQHAVLIMMEPITLGCVIRESLTITAVHSASRFFGFAPKGKSRF